MGHISAAPTRERRGRLKRKLELYLMSIQMCRYVQLHALSALLLSNTISSKGLRHPSPVSVFPTVVAYCSTPSRGDTAWLGAVQSPGTFVCGNEWTSVGGGSSDDLTTKVFIRWTPPTNHPYQLFFAKWIPHDNSKTTLLVYVSWADAMSLRISLSLS